MELVSGREIGLSELHLRSTYGGLVEGYPMTRLNDMIVDGLVEQARRLFVDAPVHMVTPVRTRSDEDGQRPLPFGPMEFLPPVICMGRFASDPISTELDPVVHHSRLVIVWLQDGPAVPNGREAPAELHEVRWEDWAQDAEI